MERLIEKTSHLLKCEHANNALIESVSQKKYEQGKIFCNEFDYKPYWCFVLEGLVGAYSYENITPYMHWAALPNQTFTGTKHEFSDSSQNLEIRFLKKTTLAMIYLPQLRNLMNEHPDIYRLFNILRQRRFTIVDFKLRVIAQPAKDRYRKLLQDIPMIPQELNNLQLAHYLYIDPKTLYNSRRKELNR